LKMRRSLVFRLVLALLGVSVIGVVLTVAFARWVAYREFDRLVLERAQNDFITEVTAYYEAQGSWQGVTDYLHTTRLYGSNLPRAFSNRYNNPPSGNFGDFPHPFYPYALVDAHGTVVVASGTYQLGNNLTPSQTAKGVPIQVNGVIVGKAVSVGLPPQLDPREQGYLQRTTISSVFAGLIAVIIALIISVFLARSLTRPLREMTAATRAMAHGELGRQVPVRSQDELGELASSFNQMSSDLARSNDLRRQMTADIAHDLRTPLSVLSGYLEALRDGVLEPSSERFDAMFGEARHLQRLIDDLRTLSLADAGELALAPTSIPPGLVLEQAVSSYGPHVAQQEVGLSLEVEPDLPRIEVDTDRMAQVFANLISNALRYTPAGGQIHLGARRQDGHVLLQVQDSGSGISPGDIPHIFDRFYRGEGARQGESGESGLGLAIAKSLIELNGGKIGVESTIGQGTTFTITFPVEPPDQPKDQTETA
jgi:two-component system sensor histidine kinase BaeS